MSTTRCTRHRGALTSTLGLDLPAGPREPHMHSHPRTLACLQLRTPPLRHIRRWLARAPRPPPSHSRRSPRSARVTASPLRHRERSPTMTAADAVTSTAAAAPRTDGTGASVAPARGAIASAAARTVRMVTPPCLTRACAALRQAARRHARRVGGHAPHGVAVATAVAGQPPPLDPWRARTPWPGSTVCWLTPWL